MKKDQNNYINQAFELAKINLGQTGTNPSVGCLVEKNGTIIATGTTSISGRPHAEHNALHKSKNVKGANLYLSLEPCGHFGKTNPCANLIIKKKIKKVYFSKEDNNVLTKNKSRKILEFNQIRVKKNLLKRDGNLFYKSHDLRHLKKLPLIDAKIAISSDYYTINKKKKWITNSHSRKRAHLLRSMYDCILTTSKTINQDNSLLNCRINGLEYKNPDIIIIDRNLKVNLKRAIIQKKLKRRIIIVTTSNNKKKINKLKENKIKVKQFRVLNNKKDIQKLFNYFNSYYSRILIESGLTFINSFFKMKLIHNLFVFKSKKKLKKNGTNNTSILNLKKINLNKYRIPVYLFGDQLFNIRIL